MKKNNKYIGVGILVLILSCIMYKQVYGLEIAKEKKSVYLTFDDGPSPGITNEIMKILHDNNVKATFFVIGSKARENSEVIKKISESGMSIMPHTDRHEYSKIYLSAKNYFDDLRKCEDTIASLTGKMNFKFIRMPGGSDNSVASYNVLDEIREKIISSDRYYIDWSVDTGDTETTETTIDFIESRVREYGGLYRVEVVLMHDLQNKITTIESLQNIINFYKERGYEFKTLDNIDKSEIDYLKDIRVINKK